MRKRIYRLFVLLSVTSLLTILLVARSMLHNTIHEEKAECEWIMMRDPTMQSSNKARWNESMLLSLGLLAPKIPYKVINGSSTSLAARSAYQSDQKCSEYEDQAKTQLILRRVLKEVSSDANLLCQTLRNLTGRVESCFSLDSQLDDFLVNQHGQNDTWLCFHPPEITSRIYLTIQIYQLLRLKRLSSKPTIVIPLTDEATRFKNSTFTFRLFFLIESLHPVRVYVFQKGIVLLDKENWFYPIENLRDHSSYYNNDLSFYDTAVRCLCLFLNQVKLLLPVHEFKHVSKYGKVSQIVAVDFLETPSGIEMFRIHGDVQQLRPKSMPFSFRLLLHGITSTAVHFLSTKHPVPYSATEIHSILNETLDDRGEIFGLVKSLVINPFIQLEPRFQPIWTHYTASVPYETTMLNFQLVVNNCANDILFESERGNNLNISIGLGWNDFKITVTNQNPQLRPVIYLFKVMRLPRMENPLPFNTNNNLSVCILEQECSLKFKEKSECGLQASPFGSWSSALTDWKRLPTCPFGNSEGAWMIPCSSCRLERSCYWSRARWQPFECRYPPYSRSELQQCLLNRKLIFVGDSTNRGLMEALLERLDGWLTMSDRTKWHSYRHRLANIDGQTQFDFDYYPKFWMSSRPSLEQTLVHMLRRAEAGQNDTTLIIGGLDWMSVQHFDTIQRVLATQGLSKMAVVIKMSGAGFQSDRRREGSVSTTRRLGHLSQTARLLYGFRTIDTWNMTVARFRDFLPGRCRCHFHQITKVGESESTSSSIADAMKTGKGLGRFRADGPINQAYTEMLVDQLCGQRINI